MSLTWQSLNSANGYSYAVTKIAIFKMGSVKTCLHSSESPVLDNRLAKMKLCWLEKSMEFHKSLL